MPTPKRVLVLVPFPMDADNLAKRRAQMSAVKLGPDIAFDFRPVAIAPVNYVSQQDMLLADIGMVEAGHQAEAEGYDAVCIDTVSDSGMTALRSVLSIPVIGAGRHAILMALTLGKRFSFVSMWDRWRPLYEKTLAELGLQAKCASMRSADLEPNNQSLLSGREEEVFPVLLETAKRCVEEDRADALVWALTALFPAMTKPEDNLLRTRRRQGPARVNTGHSHAKAWLVPACTPRSWDVDLDTPASASTSWRGRSASLP